MDEPPDARSWTIQHFSMANAEGTARDDVPLLMRRVANVIEALGPVLIQDVVFRTEVTAEGLVHSFTVYFDRVGEDGQRIPSG